MARLMIGSAATKMGVRSSKFFLGENTVPNPKKQRDDPS